MTQWKRIFSPLASLRFTVALLILSMLLVFAGTLAQREQGVWQVQDQYFHSLICWIPVQNLIFKPIVIAGKPLIVPMAGGYLLGLCLLINLLAAHAIRFKFVRKDWFLLPALALIFIVGRMAENLDVYWTVLLMLIAGIPFFTLLPVLHKKRTGVILIHLGLILLLVGEGISSNMKVESQMAIAEGHGSNWSQDIRDPELAITDASAADHNTVTIIPAKRLIEAEKQKQTITDSQLPFDVQVDAYYDNAARLGPFQAQGRTDLLRADSGSLKDVFLMQLPPVAGAAANDGKADLPATFVTVYSHGNRLGRYVLPTELDAPQTVKIGDKAYQISLRFHRYYTQAPNPYTLYLQKFNITRYDNSDTVKDYSSVVRLIDPSRQVDREIRIWMNHPLRYNGKTIYQAGFDPNTEKGTILQVVTNPGWQMPYIACAIGFFGLLIHFLIKLSGFLDQQSKLAARQSAVPPTSPGGRKPTPVPPTRRPMPATPALSMDRRSGSIKAIIVLPICMVITCVGMIIHQAIPAPHSGTEMDVEALGALPILQDGRVQPFDSYARNSLKIISGRESFDENAKTVTPSQWLINLQSDPNSAAEQKVIRIDMREISGILSSNFSTKMFSLDDVLDHWPQLGDQMALLADDSGKEMTLFEHKLAELRTQLQVYFQASGEAILPFLLKYPLFPIDSADLAKKLELPANQHLASWLDIRNHPDVIPEMESLRKQVAAQGESDLTPDQKALLRLNKATASLLSLLSSGPMLIAPLHPGEQWMTLRQAADEEDRTKQAIDAAYLVADIRHEYTEHDAAKFNQAVASYHARLEAALPKETSGAAFEAWYNHFDPFTVCIIFYVLCFVLVGLSWLNFSPTWSTTFYWSAITVVAITLLLHTFGLIARVEISGYPPVTNLASSAIFIAWGIVLLALVFEYFYRNSIGVVAATIAGVASLLIAGGLAADGDTFKVLQAVLKTNFWLATHVVCVTLGYASTFLAGVLGVIYVIRSAFGSLSKDDSRELARMIYGVACFAILFSFVGTVLGGIWADQSWGRFWGWDPKENGAVLVVLSNALLLHARWGGMIKARGIAGFAIFGNIITGWSWFGTNMLGIGLHAYGFMEKAPTYLISFVIAMLALIVINLFLPEPSDSSRAKIAVEPTG